LFGVKLVFAESPDLFKLFADKEKLPTLTQVKAAIAGGANVNARGAFKGFADATVLMLAARSTNDPAIIAMLVEAGADVNAHTKEDGFTPLLCAVVGKAQNPLIVKTLVKLGSNVNQKRSNGWTPFMSAASFGKNPALLNALVEVGADIKERDNEGNTALILAAEVNESEEMIRTLLKLGADVNAKAVDGWTALMSATAKNKNPQITKILIEAGADISAKDGKGKSAIDYAERNEALKKSAVFKELTAAKDTPQKDQPIEAITYNLFGPVIKGLSLGMNIDTVPAILQESLGVKCKVIDMGSGYTTGIFGLFVASANKSKHVTMITYLSPIFNAADMEPEAFAREIINAYKIPETKPFLHNKPLTRSIEVGHEYSSPDGWKIKIISPENSVVLEIIPKTADRKFD